MMRQLELKQTHHLINPSFLQRVTWLLPHADMGEGTENSKNVQEPQDNGYNHDGIQDRLNGTRHWYESVDEPKNNTSHDQDYYYLN
jgi:hypothetical protein